MTTPLPAPVANQLARSLGHLPGAIRDNGVMRWATCQTCKAAMVERVDDGKGFTGSMVDKACKGNEK